MTLLHCSIATAGAERKRSSSSESLSVLSPFSRSSAFASFSSSEEKGRRTSVVETLNSVWKSAMVPRLIASFQKGSPTSALTE